jgi:uncharacterized protein with von Willebrand factor type A (vWA) domain
MPFGNHERPFNLPHLVAAAGATYVARWTCLHIRRLTRSFGEALQRVGSEARVVGFDGHSDYGAVFGQFSDRSLEAITPRSTVIVTGDARTNYHDPNLPAFERIAGAARALYWLNPERHPFWNTGDSVIGRYAPLCDRVVEVRNLRQLEAFVERVALPVGRPVCRVG